MLKLITQKTKFSKLGFLISLVLLFIGGMLVTSKLSINWIILTVVGSISIIMQFGMNTFKILMKKPIRHSGLKITISILLAFITSLGATFIGNILDIKSIPNNNVSNLKELPLAMRVLGISKISFSLIGEELFTAALALPLLYLMSKKMEIKVAWVMAVLISSFLFGLIHYKVYNWNLYQMFISIGFGRLPFTWVWVKTDSLRGGIIAHIIYDLLIFVPTTLL